ncbi:MAG TPA: hypothetical protein VFO69_04270 [Allosphingosinicella sp.]|nr:hypothetical protein [Allosphingosinicella sp.]
MSWVQSKASLSRLAIAALLVTGAASAAANVLVIRSTGPSAKSYPPGRSLPDNARIALQASDVVVVLANGATRTFRGPGNFSPTAAVQAGTRTVTTGGRQARIGAVRNAGVVPRSPTIWHVDATQSGTFCLATTADVNLWRPDASQTASLTITGPGGESQTIDWPAGQAVLPWPASVGIADGGEYRLRQAGVAVPTRITFQTVDSQLGDIQAVAEALIANDCQDQLNVLVETTAEEAAPAS